MAATNSSSSYLLDIVRLHKNAIEILNALALASSTPNETIDVSVTLDNGNTSTLSIPSLGYLRSELRRIDTNVSNMSGIGESDVLVRQSDGSFKRIIAVNLSPSPRRITSLTTPTTFVPQDNYFFKNLMSPLMTVRFDLSGKIDSNVKHVQVRRLLVDVDTADKKTIFENAFKGKNDISFDDCVLFLTDSLINFNIDDETMELPPATPRYYGTFSVVKILDRVSGQNNIRRYVLDSLNYTDSISRVKSNQALKPGDVLIKGSSLFSVTEIDETKNIVTLKRTQGADSIEIGVDVLSIQSELYNPQILNVPIAMNEYEILFMKPIQDNITSSEWSPGVGFYTNDLFYQSSKGNVGISDFYDTYVIDLSEDLVSHAREKRVSILTGTKPSPPELRQDNFVVKRLNDQIDGTQAENELNQIYSQIHNNDKKISSLNIELNKLNQNLTATDTVSATSTASIAYQSSKESIQKQINSLNEMNSGLLTKAENILAQNPNISTTPSKYSIFGFWEIPAARVSIQGKKQEVIAFRVRYRYLPMNESTASAREVPFTSQDGSTASAYFSRWQEFVTKPRNRVVLPDGSVVWRQSDIQNPDEVNTQQLEVAITQGERVEIQVSSISEAGWPANPIESDFSTSIVVDFPESLVKPDVANLVTSIQTKLAQKGLQDSLTNIGITEHIQNSTQVGSVYVAHNADEISYSIDANSVVTLAQKIKDLEAQLSALRTKVETGKGMLKVSIIDPYGNSISVANGATISANAGFYVEDLKLVSESERPGAIVTKQYNLVIENSSATPLMLLSQFPGLLRDGLPSSAGNIFNGVQVPQDYSNKAYNRVPIGLAAAPMRTRDSYYLPEYVANQPIPYQSSQQASQFIYSRAVSLNGLYNFYDQFAPPTQLIPNSDLGYNAPTHANVWSNDFDSNTTNTVGDIEYLSPLGGGSLTSFCVSVDHPAIKFVKVGTDQYSPSTTNKPTLANYFNSPMLNSKVDSMASNAPFRYPQFHHNSAFVVSPSDDPTRPKPQAGYSQFSENSQWPYPMKLGFSYDDPYLIGSDTVGSYLYIQSPSIETIKVNGSGLNSFKELPMGEEYKVVIPIIFQYRFTDKLNNLGGLVNRNFSNLTSVRGLGIDISCKGDPLFSFDFIISSSYVSDGSTRYTSQLTSTIQI